MEKIGLYLDLFQTLLLLVITAGIAFLLFRIKPAARGTRKSLASRRQEIYNDLLRVLTMLARRGELRKEELLDFRSRTHDAAVVFDAEIAAYIDEVYNRGVKLVSTNELLQGEALSVGEERDRLTVENARQGIWLADQLAMLGKKFARYPDIRPS